MESQLKEEGGGWGPRRIVNKARDAWAGRGKRLPGCWVQGRISEERVLCKKGKRKKSETAKFFVCLARPERVME